MRATDLRLVPAAIAAWVAAWVLVGAPGSAAPIGVALWLLAGVMVSMAFVARSWRAIAVIIATAAAAGALVTTTIAVREPLRSVEAIVDDREFEVVLTSPILAGSDRARGTIGATPVLLVGADLDAAASGADASAERLGQNAIGLGATLLVRGRLEPVDDGGAIAGILIVDRAEVIRPPPPVLAWGESLRAGFRSLAAQLPGNGGALLTGLAIGDDAGVPPALDDAMTTTSLSHLTAVSGANCAVVVGAALLLAAALGMPKRARLVVAGFMLIAFVVLVTPQPSVVRAAVMAALALVALAVDRPVRGVSLLAVAVTVVLAVDPWAAREVGFVLSVLATGGLLLVAGPLAVRLTRVLPTPIAYLVAIPAAAQLACQPVIVLIDPSLPLAGVVANLLAGPAAPIATGFGLIACLLQPIAPVLALGVAWVAWVASSWIAGVATVLADAPFARVPWPEGLIGFLLAAIGSVAVAWWAMSVGRVGHPAGSWWLQRSGRIAGAMSLCWIVVVAGVGAGGLVSERLGRPGDWTIAQCDVGQGDAVLLRSSGAVALVDTGAEPELLSACLDTLGIDRIDLLVLTHFDHDHVGGVAAVTGRVDTVLIGPSDARAQAMIIEPLIAAGAAVHRVALGQTGVLGDAPWRVLWPPVSASEPGNAASVVLRVETDPPIVLLGDLGQEEQRRMLATAPPGRVAVVKVSHHGSADQSDRLMAALDAEIGLIGVGADNGYGHPTPELLDLLESTGTTVVRSDRDGLALLAPTTDGGGGGGVGGNGGGDGAITVWRQRSGDGSAVAARLDPPGDDTWSSTTSRVDRTHSSRSSGRDGGRDGRTRRAEPSSPCRRGVCSLISRAVVGPHPAGACRARHRPGAISRRSGSEPSPRPPPSRRPEPRGQRSRR